MVPDRHEVFIKTIFLVFLEPLVIHKVFSQTVVMDDIAFRSDAKERSAGDINKAEDGRDV